MAASLPALPWVKGRPSATPSSAFPSPCSTSPAWAPSSPGWPGEPSPGRSAAASAPTAATAATTSEEWPRKNGE